MRMYNGLLLHLFNRGYKRIDPLFDRSIRRGVLRVELDWVIERVNPIGSHLFLVNHFTCLQIMMLHSLRPQVSEVYCLLASICITKYVHLAVLCNLMILLRIAFSLLHTHDPTSL